MANHVNELVKSLYELLDKQLFCDAVILADDGELPAHSLVLSAVSPIVCRTFADLTNSDGAFHVRFHIPLPGCNVATVRILLRFLYTGELVIPVQLSCVEHFHKVIAACGQLGIDVNRMNGAKVILQNFESGVPASSQYEAERELSNIGNSGSHNVPVSSLSNFCASPGIDVNPVETIFVHLDQTAEATAQANKPDELSLIDANPAKCDSPMETKTVRRHRRRKFKREPGLEHVCSVCGKRFLRLTCYQKHVKSHSNNGMHVCHQCGKVFSTPVLLKSHAKCHTTARRFTCFTCGKGYRCRQYLTIHQMAHNGAKPYLCEECGRSFYAAVNLKRHALLRHENQRPFSCSQCGKGFVARSRLQRHMEVHDAATRSRYSCEVCGSSFANAGNLLRHRRSHSDLPRPFVCSVCNRGFTQKTTLQAHEAVHKPEVKALQQLSAECPVCHKQLSKVANLRKHMQLHVPASERSVHKCGECSKTFSTREYLSRHVSAVHILREHSCPWCKARFVTEQQLATHMSRVHTTLKCRFCPLVCTSARELNVHLREHGFGRNETRLH